MPHKLPQGASVLFNRGKLVGAILCNLLLILFAVIGIIIEFATYHLTALLKFGVLANLFAVVTSAVVIRCARHCLQRRREELSGTVKALSYTSTSLLVIVFATVIILQGPSEGYLKSMFLGSSLFLHFLVPILAFLSFVLFEQHPRIRFRNVWWPVGVCLVYSALFAPLVYFNFSTNPYSFLDILSRPLWVIVLTVLFFLAASFFLSWLVFLCDEQPKSDDYYYEVK